MNGNNQNIIDDCLNDLNKVKYFIQLNPLDSMCQYLISYSVVRACGAIEVVAKNTIYDYLALGAKAETMKYLEIQILDSPWNPSTGKIKGFIEKINPLWANNFKATVSGTKEETSLNSLVNLFCEWALENIG